VELQTTLSEEYLKLGRWTIFLEDEQRHQFDPVRVEEHPVESGMERRLPMTQDGSEGFPEARFLGQPLIRRDLELYFPKYQLTGEPILSAKTTTLKLVFLQADDTSVRAEGTWDFPVATKR
jgi:hypothetical protein